MKAQEERKISLLDLISNSVSLKAFVIFILSMFLLIPAAQISSLVTERQSISKGVEQEIGQLIAGPQVLAGPILSIPCEYKSAADENGKKASYIKTLHVLPARLDVATDLETFVKERGIYDAKYYDGSIKMKAVFDSEIEIPSGAVRMLWEEASINMGVTDQRGIKELVVKMDGENMDITSGLSSTDLMSSGFSFSFPKKPKKKNESYTLEMDLRLMGTASMQFIPAGKESHFSMDSDWEHPSYFGNFLPDDAADSSNHRTWSILELNRTFPQFWLDREMSYYFKNSTFGIRLIDGVDHYQKVHRLVRYAILIIGLTFLVFFIVEILKGYKVHPFQYILVGVALIIFFTLLIGLVEHISFNLAYGLSALAVTLLVSLYSWNLFGKLRDALIILALLSSTYLFMFVTVQMEDYALLMGAIGLFVIIAITMYATRKIDWYAIRLKQEG